MPPESTYRHKVMMDILDFKETEADVAAEFYHCIQEYGLQVKMEASLPSDVHRSGFMRADAVIFDRGEIVCAVEFKAYRKLASKPESRQYRAYAGQDFPFFFCCGMNEVDDTIDNVIALADKMMDSS